MEPVMQFNLTFEGNVADAPELRFTRSGKALCKFRVGHNMRRRTTAGEWVNGPTIWFTVTPGDVEHDRERRLRLHVQGRLVIDPARLEDVSDSSLFSGT
jgi:single-stranded DNA-binding protein